MNWKFWRKEKNENAERPKMEFEIPTGKVLEIKRLADAANNKYPSHEANYLLWTAIAEVVPETMQGYWTLVHPTALTAKVVERRAL